MSQQTTFINRLAPHAQASQRRTGIPASVTMAQAILESGWGRSGLAKEANNFFGIKAGSWPGRVYSGTTWEQDRATGKRTTYKGTGFSYGSKQAALAHGAHPVTLFRHYDSFEDGLTDKARVFYNGYYDEALPWRSRSLEFLERMAPTYATDLLYGQKLKQLISRYNLLQYDVHPKDWDLDASLVPEPWYGLWARAYKNS